MKSDKKITVIGSGNCDIFIQTDRMPTKGETLSAKKLFRAPGGKVSKKYKSLGIKSSSCYWKIRL